MRVSFDGFDEEDSFLEIDLRTKPVTMVEDSIQYRKNFFQREQ